MGTFSTQSSPGWGQTQYRRIRILGTMVLLSFTGLLQKAVPMKWWAPLLGAHDSVPATWTESASRALPMKAANRVEQRVIFLISRASTLLPWQPTCLAQATAAQMILRMNNTSAVAVIGLRKTQNTPDSQDNSWQAHAWLLGSQGALTGGIAADGFTAVTVFSHTKGLHASDIDPSQFS